jgi:hypothetical protein
MKGIFIVTILLGAAGFHPPAEAGDQPSATAGKPTPGVPAAVESNHQKSMDMNAPMPTGMAKPGMKKGDVKKSAEKKEQKMEEIMHQKME